MSRISVGSLGKKSCLSRLTAHFTVPAACASTAVCASSPITTKGRWITKENCAAGARESGLAAFFLISALICSTCRAKSASVKVPEGEVGVVTPGAGEGREGVLAFSGLVDWAIAGALDAAANLPAPFNWQAINKKSE